MIPKETIYNLLTTVSKPARYAGGEWNAIVKPHARVKVGLCFPDLYEVGMSNNGIQILYHAINAMQHAAAERVFAVEHDFENQLRQSHIPLYTLETYTPLCELDMLGFNAACELLYTNILQVIDLGTIPLYARDRGDSYPLIIIGGEAMSNPAPVLPFADAIFVGDGEEAITRIAQVLIEKKDKQLLKDEVLTKIAAIEGVLVSRDVEYGYTGNALTAIKAPAVYKCVERRFQDYEVTRPVVPSIRSVQDRVSVQLDRGCKNLCKFCHAGYWELPYRKVEVSRVAQAIVTTLQSTGFNDVSLFSLSVGDYTDIVSLLNIIVPELIEQGVSISLPSLRVDMQSIAIIESISDLKKTALTFAVESASDVLRYRAYKRLTIEEIMNIITELSRRGWQRIKLYFMIGLPGCDNTDEAAAIIAFMKQACSIDKRMRYNVTISPFVPKAHTPFQYEKQYDEHYCLEVVNTIKRNVPKNVTIKNHDVYASLIEGVLARGDSMLADAIVGAYNAGARLDLWGEHFDFTLWDNALQTSCGNWRRYLNKRSDHELLPWSMIHTRYERLIEKKKDSIWDGRGLPHGFKDEIINREAFANAAQQFTKRYAMADTLRIHYAKKGRARFIGHIDTMEIVKRALRMAHIPVAYTRGYNKHERLITGPALPLGYESYSEFVDIHLYENCSAMSLQKLQVSFPEGFEVVNLYHHDASTLPLKHIVFAEYLLQFTDNYRFTLFINRLESKNDIVKTTKKGLMNLRFDDAIASVIVADSSIKLIMALGEHAIRPDTLVADWCGVHNPLTIAAITKVASYYLHNDELKKFH